MHYQSSATLSTLHARAAFLAKIRQFFSERDVIEVDTPLLAKSTALDPHIQSMKLEDQPRFLQTSPEFCMKRLLAQGLGSIYQLGKAFRQGEQGEKHNPEFTMLEWYRPQWELKPFIEELNSLLQYLLDSPPCQYVTYQALFEEFCHINPHAATLERCYEVAKQVDGAPIRDALDKDGWLGFIQSYLIEPHIGQQQPLVVTDFPASQSALAKLIPGEPPVAARFEVFFKGFEIANGYDELNCANEQRERFVRDNELRQAQGLPLMPLDERFLSAVDHLPDCCGVAVGVDRLLMIALGKESISEVLPFAWDNV